MKFYLFILMMSGFAVGGGYAQEQASEPFVIKDAVDYVELDEDRIVEGKMDGTVAVEVDNAGASYTGTNVNISVNAEDGGFIGHAGVLLEEGKSVHLLTSGEGVWNRIRVYGASSYGIKVRNASETSLISNTRIDVVGESSYGLSVEDSSHIELDNVKINVLVAEGKVMSGFAIAAGNNATVTNKARGGVSIETDALGMAGAIIIGAGAESAVDLYDATITVGKTSPMASPIFGVVSFVGSTGGTVSLTSSTVVSSDGNLFVAGYASTSGRLVLDDVNLDGAKNQVIMCGLDIEVSLLNGTNFDGYTVASAFMPGSPSRLVVDISLGASWNVTQNSTTGDGGSLFLGVGSTISFAELSEGSFTSITSASIALESGAILMLGATAEEILALLDGNEGTYDVKLFTTDNKFSNDGVVLVTSDGRVLEYTPDNLGKYTLMGILPVSIPEPTTGALWLSAFGLFAFRRMKN